MADIKTKPETASVAAFIAGVDQPGKRTDAAALDALFARVTGQAAVMWGPTIVGYGQYHYRYASGHEGDMCRVGFSPRKAKHSLYLACDSNGPRGAEVAEMLARLGKYTLGNGGCLYVNKLADIDMAVLDELVAYSWRRSFETWPD